MNLIGVINIFKVTLNFIGILPMRLSTITLTKRECTSWKLCVFGVILVRISLHSDCIRRDTPNLSALVTFYVNFKKWCLSSLQSSLNLTGVSSGMCCPNFMAIVLAEKSHHLEVIDNIYFYCLIFLNELTPLDVPAFRILLSKIVNFECIWQFHIWCL